MKKLFLFFVPLFLLAACGDSDDYHYPSVKLEYLTAFSGADGTLQSVITDAGRRYPVLADASGVSIKADSLLRIVCNYEVETADDGAEGVRLYGLLTAVAPLPKPADKFEKGIKTDPVALQSIWMGLDYLNVIFTVKAQSETHRFHFIEDEVMEVETGHLRVNLTLYHDDGGDVRAYSKRAYLSVPLWHYVTDEVERITVQLSWNTYDGSTESREFEYRKEESF